VQDAHFDYSSLFSDAQVEKHGNKKKTKNKKKQKQKKKKQCEN
jgi:hypothetical protein